MPSKPQVRPLKTYEQIVNKHFGPTIQEQIMQTLGTPESKVRTLPINMASKPIESSRSNSKMIQQYYV